MVRDLIIRDNDEVDVRTREYALVVDGDLISLAYVNDADNFGLEHLGTFILVPHA